jgi:phosphohistidine phosphatase
MSDEHRTLVLLRHAKSGYPDEVADHDRPLAPRGVREAGLAGDWLRANLPSIDAVLCSTAARTRETLAQTRVEAPVRYAKRLYGATPGIVIAEINTVGEQTATLLVVGHEPAMTQAASGLAGAQGTDPAVVEQLTTKFPTSAMAVLRVPGRWDQLELGGAALVGFHVPR